MYIQGINVAQNDNCESVTLTGKVAARAAVVVFMLRASVADVFGILANLCAISNGALCMEATPRR